MGMEKNLCSRCGEPYVYERGRWVCKCCGAVRPSEISNEEENLLSVAFQKIRLGDFEEAESLFQDLVERFPKNPEAHWGLTLAKCSVKYERDTDGKMVPTCSRISKRSIFKLPSFKKAMELGDDQQKSNYEEQANKIDKIRAEWLRIGKKLKPYDVFISYKDTELDSDKMKTDDHYRAYELYNHLTSRGYRVFFARKSLQSMAGEDYEPYIYQALETAKAMIVYASKPEYVSATWVKNEWSRFAQKIRDGEKAENALVVVYHGFDPSALPRSLSKIQNLDATSLGFSRDLDAYLDNLFKKGNYDGPRKRRRKRVAWLVTALSVAAAAAIAIAVVNQKVFVPANHYQDGLSLLNEGKYEEALALLSNLDYQDAPAQVLVAKAGVAFGQGDYETGVDAVYDAGGTIEVEYDADGGSLEGTKSIIKKKAGGKITGTAKKDGYVFAGWKMSQYSIKSSTGNYLASLSLKAQYEEAVYHITYELNGGSLASPIETYTLSTADFSLGIPTKEKASFVGWTGTGLSGLSTNVKIQKGSYGDRSYEAHWQESDRYVVFHGNGATSGTMANQYLAYGKAENLVANSFARDGYIFQGWATSADGGLAYLDGSLFVAGDALSYDLYAIWAVKPGEEVYRITYSLGGGHLPDNVPHDYTAMTESFDLPTPTYDGYEFLGWSGENINGIAKTVTIAKGSQGDRTYVAHWKELDHTITFHGNGATSGTMEPQYLAKGEAAYLKANAFEREGYYFSGWAISASGTKSYDDEASFTMGDNRNYDLYALWTALDAGLIYKEVIEYNPPAPAKKLGYSVEWDKVTPIKKVVVPAEHEGYPVITVENQAFAYAGDLESIEFSEGLLNVNGNPFVNCLKLKELFFPNSVDAINVYCGSPVLTDAMPPYLEFNEHGNGLYLGNRDNPYALLVRVKSSDITELEVAPGCKNVTLSTSTAPCTKLKTVSLPDGLRVIKAAFREAPIESVTIPSTVKTIGLYSFSETALKEVVIPDSVTKIDQSAFQNCLSLANVTIGAGVESMGSGVVDNGFAFSGCNAITSFVVSAQNPNYTCVDGILYKGENKIFTFPYAS